MTRRLYTAAAAGLLGPLANVTPTNYANLDAVLLSSGYTFSAAHVNADATGFQAAILGRAASIPGVSVTGGLLTATSPIVVSGLGAQVGNTAVAYALIEPGAAASARLVWYDNEATNFPLLLNGADVNINIASGIAQLQGVA